MYDDEYDDGYEQKEFNVEHVERVLLSVDHSIVPNIDQRLAPIWTFYAS